MQSHLRSLRRRVKLVQAVRCASEEREDIM